MTLDEAARVLKFVVALGNGQQFTEHTNRAWWLVLQDVPYDEVDVQRAVREIALEQTYVDAGAVARRVFAFQAARVKAIKAMPEPNVDPDNARAYLLEGRMLADKVRSGQWGEEQLARYAESGGTLSGAPRRVQHADRKAFASEDEMKAQALSVGEPLQ